MAKDTFELWQKGDVSGFLHRSHETSHDCMVLTHGAGANCRSPLLVKVAEVFCLTGINVLRTDMAFRKRRSTGPPSPHTAAQDREGLRDAAKAARATFQGRTFLGGHSYGGRQASMLAADEPELVDGLLLMAYPLHPPQKPEQLRTAHFPQLRTPALFVHGDHDPFGTPEELREAINIIPIHTRLVIANGAGHDLKGGKFSLVTELPVGLTALVK